MSLWFCFSDLCLEWLPAIALVGFCWKNCCASKLQWASLNSFDWDWDFFSLVTIWIYIMSFDIWSISKRMRINLKLKGGDYLWLIKVKKKTMFCFCFCCYRCPLSLSLSLLSTCKDFALSIFGFSIPLKVFDQMLEPKFMSLIGFWF